MISSKTIILSSKVCFNLSLYELTQFKLEMDWQNVAGLQHLNEGQ